MHFYLFCKFHLFLLRTLFKMENVDFSQMANLTGDETEAILSRIDAEPSQTTTSSTEIDTQNCQIPGLELSDWNYSTIIMPNEYHLYFQCKLCKFITSREPYLEVFF